MTQATRLIPHTLQATLLAATLLLIGCDNAEELAAPPAGTPDALDFAVQQSVEETIVPSIEAFAEQSRSLKGAVMDFCADPDLDGLAAAQRRWSDTARRWNRAVLYNFGPLNDDIFAPKIHYIESMRQRGIDYTAKVRHEIDQQLAAEAPLDPSHFASLRQNQTGLLPLEILLFESTAEGRPQAPEAILADYREHPRKCDYLVGIGNRLAEDAGYVARGWTTSYKDTGEPYRDLFVAGDLDRGATPLAVLFTSIQDHLDYLKRRKLEGTLDARLAGQFYANVEASLDEIDRLVSGEHGFLAEAEARGHDETAMAVRQALNAAKLAARNGDRTALTKRVDAVGTLFREDLPKALDVELGLNFSDGD